MTTKIELLNSTYSLMRISGLTVDPTPEDIEVGLHRQEDFMAELFGDTIDVGYVFEDNPEPNTESGVEKVHHRMLTAGVATSLCLDFGKDIPQKLSTMASVGMTTTINIIARQRITEVAYPSRMPRGAGNRRYHRWRRYYPTTVVPATSAKNIDIFMGNIDDYSETFQYDLNAHGDTINNYTIHATNGLNIVSDSVSGDKFSIDYRVEAPVVAERVSAIERVTTTIITSSGRVLSTVRVFKVKQNSNTTAPVTIP